MQKLPENRQNSFHYKGKVYKAIANFGFEGWSAPFCHAYRDNIKNDTPSGYSYEDFQNVANDNHARAEIYECEGRFLIPYSTFMAEYRENMHDFLGFPM